MFNESSTPLVLRRYYQSINTSIKINADDDIASLLHEAAVRHFQQYPFHSLYFNLRNKDHLTGEDIPVPLHRNALIQQLLVNKGGSCYHHNALFQAILEDNGIDSWFVSCLVHDPMSPDKTFDLATHIAIVFKHNDKLYLFDPGWDGSSLSVYPLPEPTDPVARDNQHQIRYTGHPDYPFSFEEIKPAGAVTRYDFNLNRTNLADYERAIHYLNAKTYAFNTLFLFTKISENQEVIRLINRRLIIQSISGVERHNAELIENVSLLDTLTELLGPQEGLTKDLAMDDFKNPELGRLICQAAPELNNDSSSTLAASHA
jgi:arylamine N-acetyltransferase